MKNTRCEMGKNTAKFLEVTKMFVSPSRPTEKIPRCLHPSTPSPSQSRLMSWLATGAPGTPRRVPEPVDLRPHTSRAVSGASRGVSPPVRGAAALTEEWPLSLFWSNGQIRSCFFLVLPLYRSKTTLKTGHFTRVARSKRAGSMFLRSSSVDPSTQRTR